MYVYLVSGQIDTVPSISRVTVSGEKLELRRRGAVVATYPRGKVYFASRDPIAPQGFD
jgi:hypothetical protein